MATAKTSRQNEIVKYIKAKKTATSTELSEYFSVTEETIRKDLQELSERGDLIRTFGGAAIREYSVERPLDQRIIQNYTEKQKIACAAAKLITADNLIVMDAGSTISVLAKEIPSNLNVVVLTNSLENTNSLAQNPGVTVYCTGGKLHKKSLSFQGILTENAVRTYNAEKAFISCAALDRRLGVMDTNEEEARIKRKMMEISREVYLLTDSSKIGNIAHITTCPISALTAIVTDNGVTPQTVREFEDAGVRVIVAE